MRSNLTDLRSFTMLEGVGHWPQLEAPDATNAALLAFLRSLRTVAAELPNEVWAQISPQKSARVY
jgi:hypothetical protein